MAKKVFEVDNLFSQPKTEKKIIPPAAPEQSVQPVQAVEAQPAVVLNGAAAQAVVTPEQQVDKQTQKKQASNKARKEAMAVQVRSTKHTFPIPDDLWADVETLLYAKAKTGQKMKQNQLIIELLTKEVEANRELIESYK